MSAFYTDHSAAVEEALRKRFQNGAINMGGDVLSLSTEVTPRKDGDLRIRRRVVPLPNGARVEWLASYAAVQDKGVRRGRPFQHYTTPGTGPNFVKFGIDEVVKKLASYFK